MTLTVHGGFSDFLFRCEKQHGLRLTNGKRRVGRATYEARVLIYT